MFVRFIILLMNIIILSFNTALASIKDWPQEAQDYLNEIPGKELNLDFVVARSVSESDIFSLHKMEYLAAEAQYLSALSREDLMITASLFRTDNRNEPQIPQFMPTSTETWQAQVGFEQFLSTGTTVRGGLAHSSQTNGFQSFPDNSFEEGKLSLSLSQSLLNDLGGISYRKTKEASKKLSQANELGVVDKMEDSVFETIRFFYEAWLKQETLQNLEESLARRNKLNRIFQRQKRRGLVETSEALQVQTSVLSNQADLANTQQDLQNMWEELVTQLKLPETFLDVPAEEVPIRLDRPEAKAVRLCKTYDFKDIQKNTSGLLQAQNLIESAQARYEGLRPQLRPDLDFQAEFVANGIDESAGDAWKDVGGLDNPALTLGLSLKLPVQNRKAKSDLILAKIEFERAKVNKQILENNMKVQWRSLCHQLSQQIENRNHFKKISQTDKKRVQLNHRRFRLGRLSAFEWVQTEDDEARSFLKLQQSEIQVRLLAWQVQKLTGQLNQRLQKFLKVNHESID